MSVEPWTRSGTYKGGMLGRRAIWSGTSIYRLAGGKIVELWV